MWTFNDILKAGTSYKGVLKPANENNWFTISYTSGTTGNPKGVVIT